MALIYDAELSPSKPELLAGWLPTQSWWPAPGGPLKIVGAYRFDDPDGEVGIETFLLRIDEEQVAQVPLTYRGAPLEDAADALVGTMEHSVLGRRWIYDGCGDPVYATALATAILTGGRQAALEIVSADSDEADVRESATRVVGSGTPGTPVTPIRAVAPATDGTSTTIHVDGLQLTVRRLPDRDESPDGSATLVGVWPGRDESVVLARIT